MRKNYSNSLITFRNKLNVFITLMVVLTGGLTAQQTYTFTNAGASGRLGPTQLQVNSAYALTNLNGNVVSPAGIQSWTVPTSGMYKIEVYGASGGSVTGLSGYGAKVMGDVNLTGGSVLQILVGQMGTSYATGYSDGGGGGSFVVQAGTLLFAAGGGGGAAQVLSTSQNANILTTVANSLPSTFGSAGASWASNGVHFTYAIYTTVGQSFANGGNGQAGGQAGGWPGGLYGEGGFGGGGSSCSCNQGGGGGGGGYVGGGGGGSGYNSGTGGSSYIINTAVNSSGTGLTTFGHGRVVITALCNITTANAVPGPICSGNSATLTTNAISNYVWSNGASSSSLVVSPTITTTYTLTATSPSNCTASSVITVTVNNTPTVSALASSTVLCAGKSVTLNASGANTYTWANGFTSGTSFTPASTADYTVTGTNACGTASAVTTITVNPLPSISGSVNNPTVCSGLPIILNGSGSVSGYTWSPFATNNTALIANATTNYTVTGAGANSCTNIAVVGVTVLISPTITPVASPTAICLGQTATLSAVGATGYTWTPGSNPNTFSVAVSPAIATTYTVTRSNGQCVTNSTVFLQVNAVPNMVAGASPNQICAGTGVNLNVFGAITYTWLPGGFTQANFTVYPNFSTCYTVTGSNGSCTAVSAVCVTVNPSPSISILTPTTTICKGASLTLTTTGATNFTWSPSSNVNNSTELISPATTTIISVTGSNSFGCTGTANQLIVVNALPNASITSNPAFICANQTAVVGVPTSPNTIYSWSNGANTASITVNPAVSTNYVFNGTNTLTGCTSAASYSLSVFISTFTVNSPTALCSGQVATLTASGPATSYSWTNVNGGIVAPSVTVSPLINTTYIVTGITGSCSNATTVPIVVNPLPNVTASTDKPTICRFETATITGGGASTYSWSNASTSQVLTFTLSITSNYTLTGTDNNGCSKTATVTQFVAICAGLDGQAEGNRAISIYPNPNNGQFSISSDVDMSLSIVNALGQVVDTIQLNAGNNKQASVKGLSNGIYFVTGESNGLKLNKKIIVEK